MGDEVVSAKQNTSTVARMALRSTLWTTLGNYAVQIIGFVSVLWLTRLLPPEVFGTLSLATFWTGLLNVRNKLGLNYAAVQYETDGRLLGTYFVLDSVATVGSFALIAVSGITMVAAGMYSSTVAWVIVAMVGIELALCWGGPFGIAIERAMLLSRSSLILIVATIIAYALGIGLALSGYGIWSMLAIPAINYSIMSLGTVYICRRFLPEVVKLRWQFDRKLALALIKQGGATGLSGALLGLVVAQFDNFLIGTFVNTETLGYYDRAYRVAGWVNLILTMVVGRVGYVTMVRVADDTARLAHTVRLSVWVVLTLGLPLALISSFGSVELIKILYGNTYSQSSGYLKILAITNFMWTLITIAFWLSAACKQHQMSLLMSSAHVVVLVLFASPLTIIYGVNGTLIGVIIAMTLALIWSALYIERTVHLGWRDTYGAHVVAAVITAFIMLNVTQLTMFTTLPVWGRLLMIGVVCVCVFGLCLLILRRAEINDRIHYLRLRWKGN
ncbi:MAG: oligosaccharide flippase family protein [Anaerolineae bacterium]|nr:oligosaccharide flippase family protein [Anaerolineae bacterium]